MAQTVKITPATGLLEFIGDNIANKPVLQHDNLGNLTLTLQASKKFTVGGNLKVNGKVTVVQQALTDGSTITWNFNSGANATVTLGGSRTLAITGMEAGDTGLILVKQDSTGGRTLSLPGGSSIVGGGSYTASSTANTTDVLGVYFDGTTYWWTIGYNTVTPPLTSVGITGSDFVIANSPLTSNGNIGLTLATVNSTVGTFGSATAVPVITVNAKGLVTAVSATNISIPTNLDSLTDVTISSAASGQLLQFNGSQWVNWTPNFLTAETDTLQTVTTRGATTTLAITTAGLTSDYVNFKTAPTFNPVQGTMFWNVDDSSVNLQVDPDVAIKLGQDNTWFVKNQTGITIPKGTAVMATGTLGTSGRITVAPMIADGSISSKYLLGVTAENILDGADGFVMNIGKIKKINTSAYPAGAILYCDPAVAGELTSIEPASPNLKLPIAFVVNQDDTNGVLAVRVNTGSDLYEDARVQIVSALATGQLLRYNSNRWENWTPNYLTGITSSQVITALGYTPYNSTNPNGYISSYTETDTLASVTGRGATTSTPVTFNGNVTLGNSADLVFVDLAGTFPTSGKGFDWTLNNDGARIYAIQPSSDSIDLVFQLRDNATTNDRFVFWVDDYQGAAFDKYPLIIRGGTEFDLVDSGLFVRGTQVLTNARVLQNISGNISMFTNDSAYITNAALSGYATQTYVNTAISGLVDAAPGTLDTLNELAAALGDDPNFATTVATNISGKVSKAGDTMSGVLTINTNVAGLILNRDTVSNYNGIYYSTAAVPKWFIGMRENLGSNNHIHYSEELGRDILTLDVANGNATVFGTISASNFSGSSSGTNTGDQTTITGNAGSATVLQTARTLTIGNTGKSFNGSTDVAWSLAEIGAQVAGSYAAASHTHDDRYYTEAEIDSQMSTRLYQARVDSLDVDVFNATGLYRGSTSSWINRPSIIHNGGALFTIDTHPGEYHSQLFFDTGGDRLYFRNANAGNWGAWNTMLHSGNIGSFALTSYTETDTLASVTGRGNTTFSNIGIKTGTPQKALDVFGTGIIASFGGTIIPGGFAGLSFGYSESNANNDNYKKSALVFERTDNHGQGGNASGKIHFLLNNIASGSATSLSHSVMVIDTDSVATQGSARVGIAKTNPATALDVNGVITATGGNSTNWNTAFGWGNHASAGYALSSADITAVSLTASTLTLTRAIGNLTAAVPTFNQNTTGNAATATTAGFADEAQWISFPDGPRDLTDRRPNWNNRSVAWDFVTAGTADGAGNYAGVMTFSPWDGTSGSTGDSSYQFAFINESGVNASGVPGLRLRNGIDSSWNEWYQIWHSGNLTNLNQLTNGPGYITTETDTLASVTGRGATTSTPITVTATEGREVAVFLPASYGADDLVSGHEYGWYADHWRLGMTRSTASPGADFVVQWNGARRLSLTNGGNLTVTGTIGATNFSGSSSGANTGDQTTITGNAGSATVLQTARTLTIGATGKTFNGSANVSWSLAEIGAYAASNPAGYITSYTETDTLASVTGRGATTNTASIFRGGLYAQKAQVEGDYTTAALWTESYDNTTTGIAFHINGNYGGFLEMRTDRVLYWAGNTIYHSGNLTNLNQLTNGPGYITGYTETDTLNSVTTRGNTTANSVRFGAHVDINSNGSAFRFYNGVTFRGGIGLDDWAHGGSAANITVYVEGDNTLFFSTSGTKRASVSSSAFNSLVALQQNGNQVWHVGNDGAGSGLDADLLDGYHASGSVGANTVVIRDSNGYAFFNYINSNVSETENPSINSFYTSNGDGYFRKSSLAHVRNSLGNYGGWLTQAAADPLYVNVTGDSMTGPLVITGTTSGQELFAVNGVNGRLFTVTDDLSNSLFSVNTIAGLPVIEAFADNTVKLGPFSAPIVINSSGISTPSHGTSANWFAAFGWGNHASAGYALSSADITAVSLTASTLTLTRAIGNLTAAVPTFNQNTTGNAATATSLNSSNFISRTGSSGNYDTDFNNTPAGTVRHQGDDAGMANNPGGSWWFLDNYRHSNSSNSWGTQVAWGWEDNKDRLATRNVTGGNFGAWVYYLNSSNYNSYAPTLTGTGASGTWSIAVTGNSGSATVLQTARTLTIGNTGKSFNGSANVAWSLAEIGAQAAGSYAPINAPSFTGNITLTGSHVSGFGILRIDSADDMLISTESAINGWNGLRLKNEGSDYAFFGKPSNQNDKIVIDFDFNSTNEFEFSNTGTLTVADRLIELSSIRYKTQVESLTPALDKVLQLRPVYYTKIGGTGSTEIGLIAEEVAGIYPELIKYNSDGEIDGISYTRLAPILIKTIQEQQELIKKLTERIENLENR